MKRLTILTIVVLVVVIALPVAGLVLRSGSAFGGADSGGQAAITQIDPHYKPWFTSIWPQSNLVGDFMFGFQAVVGAGLLFSALGYAVGRGRGRAEAAAGEYQPLQAGLQIAYVLLAVVLLIPVLFIYYAVGYRPPSNEIIDLFFALQGAIASGFIFFAITFFHGRRKGRTQGAQASASSASSEPRARTSTGVV